MDVPSGAVSYATKYARSGGGRAAARRIDSCLLLRVSGMPSSAPPLLIFLIPQGEHPRPRRATLAPPPPAPSSCVRAACLGSRRAQIRRRSLTINSSFSSTAPTPAHSRHALKLPLSGFNVNVVEGRSGGRDDASSSARGCRGCRSCRSKTPSPAFPRERGLAAPFQVAGHLHLQGWNREDYDDHPHCRESSRNGPPRARY